MDRFERLTGFREAGYGETQARLRVVDGRLVNRETGERFAVGTLTRPPSPDCASRPGAPDDRAACG